MFSCSPISYLNSCFSICLRGRKSVRQFRELDELSQESFKLANRQLLTVDPAFAKVYKKGETEDNTVPTQIFNKLMKCLHEKANEFECDIVFPKDYDSGKRNWEWSIHEELIQKVVEEKLQLELYQQMLNDLEKKNEETKANAVGFLKLGEYDEKLKESEKKNEENKAKAIEFLKAIQLLGLNKKHFLEQNDVGNVQILDSKWNLHTEDKGQMRTTLFNAQKIILHTYNEYKKAAELDTFFSILYRSGPSIELTLMELQERIVDKYFDVQSFQNSNYYTISSETKQKNLDLLLNIFTKIQAIEYAKKYCIKHFNAAQISHISQFREEHFITENFICFLQDKKIIGQKTKEGPITNEDIERYIKESHEVELLDNSSY